MAKTKVNAPVEEGTSKSMVIVTDEHGLDYCSGFVAFSGAKRGTYVVTQPEFVEGREDDLVICFFDKTSLPASLIRTEPFALLRTEFHPHCKRIQLEKENITTPKPAIVFPPSSPTSFFHLPCFVTAESVDSYPVRAMKPKKKRGASHSSLFSSSDRVPGSENLFLVDCHYSEKTSDGHERLRAAPVYAMSGTAMGMIMRACDGNSPMQKVAMSAKEVSTLIRGIMPPANEIKSDGDGGCSNVKKSPVNKKRRDGADGRSRRAGNKRNKAGDEGHNNSSKYKEFSGSKKRAGDKSSSAANKSTAGDKGKRSAASK